MDPAEVERFAALAERWWDRDGAFRALHALNPVRIAYVRDALVAGREPAPSSDGSAALKPLAGLRLLDVGCGGGLMAEPLCRLGADVVAIDAAEATSARPACTPKSRGSPSTTATPRRRRWPPPASASMRCWPSKSSSTVADLDAFANACSDLVKPGGSFVVATLNRTLAAYALAIVAGERILGWLPAGTHDWSRFVRPAEMVRLLRRHGLAVADMQGMVYNPLAGALDHEPPTSP